MEKIVIIGSPGAGKSTLARQLGEILRIEVIHLDRLFWEPNWKEKPRELRLQILQELVQKDSWIIEGSYLNTSEIRLRAADSIIFLDMPTLVCLWRVLKRRLKYQKELRPDLPEGCPERLRLQYILKILGFSLIKSKKLYARLRTFESERTALHRYCSSDEVEDFLRGLKQRQEERAPENIYIPENTYTPVSLSLA